MTDADDWEPGDRCPHCSSALITEYHVDVEFARHLNGGHQFAGSGDRLQTLRYECAECEVVLDTGELLPWILDDESEEVEE